MLSFSIQNLMRISCCFLIKNCCVFRHISCQDFCFSLIYRQTILQLLHYFATLSYSRCITLLLYPTVVASLCYCILLLLHHFASVSYSRCITLLLYPTVVASLCYCILLLLPHFASVSYRYYIMQLVAFAFYTECETS